MNSYLNQVTLLKQKNLHRRLTPISSAQEPHLVVNQREMINFSSNDYLGLAYHEACIDAGREAIQQWGTGSGSSRLVSGSLSIHHDLEKKIAETVGEERALVFSSGFQTNIGVISACLSKGDVALVDRYCHASLIDGVRLSGAKLLVYSHRDMNRLESLLQKNRGNHCWVITDSYFSMDGDIVPLDKIYELCQKNQAKLLVDEAHAIGVFGKTGGGCIEDFGLRGKIDLIVGTFSKAFGSQGGFVLASREMIDYLINKARTFIYSTGPSPANSASAIQAIDLCAKEESLRKALWNNANDLRGQLERMGMNLGDSIGPIIPIIIGNTQKTLDLSRELQTLGILAPAIRPPTVPHGTDRIRLSISAKHTKEDLNFLIQSLNKLNI